MDATPMIDLVEIEGGLHPKKELPTVLKEHHFQSLV
jgi:hypothetical protein